MVKTDPNLNAAITKWETYSEGGAPLHDHSPLSFPTLCPQPAYSHAYVILPVIRICPHLAYSNIYVYVRDPIYVCPLFIPMIRYVHTLLIATPTFMSVILFMSVLRLCLCSHL